MKTMKKSIKKIATGCTLFFFMLFFAHHVYGGSYSLPERTDSLKKLPKLNQPRVLKIDVKHISLDLKFDWVKKQALGTAALTLSPLHTTDKITLDAAKLSINSIFLQNKTTLKYVYDGTDKNDALEIKLDKVYHPGEELILYIHYQTNWVNATDPNAIWGSNGKGIRFFEPSIVEPKKRKQIWSMGEPEGNRYWFPCYDVPDDLRTSELKATVEKEQGKPMIVISNGNLVETKDNKDGTQTFHWKMDQPYANYHTFIVIGEYVNIQQSYNGVSLNNFGYPDEVDAVRASTVRLPDMVRFYSELTGTKYPYASYSQVFVQEAPWGIGYAAGSIQTENMIDDFGTHEDFFYLWDGLEAEALAQQWFGNYINCKDWSHIWLNRGFAHYFDGLYNEHKNSREEFLLWQLRADHATYLGDWTSGNQHPIVTQNYENIEAFTTDNYSYVRASLVLNLLRKELGEEAWKKALQLYIRENANKPVETSDFIKAIETASEKPMKWFFDQWIYKMGHPVFKITKYYDASKKLLTLNVLQTQQPDPSNEYPQVDFFKGHVDIEIDGHIQQVWLKAKTENTFIFESREEPKLVHFDFESAWIKEINFEKTTDELIYQLLNDADILGKQSAMNELAKLAKDEKTIPEERERIYAAFRNLILSKAYWRIRYNALTQLQSLIAPAQSKPINLDAETRDMLLNCIQTEKSWNRAVAISFLGTTRDKKYAELYKGALSDPSDRVINAAAIALGKTKSPDAYEILIKLASKPSWKNQSLISTLNGLKELGDPRGFDIAYTSLSDLTLARWTLATPIWDYRITAAQTILALDKSAEAYPLIYERLKKAVEINDINVILNNLLLITTLAEPKGQEAFDLLKTKFKEDANFLVAVSGHEEQFKAAIKKNNKF